MSDNNTRRTWETDRQDAKERRQYARQHGVKYSSFQAFDHITEIAFQEWKAKKGEHYPL